MPGLANDVNTNVLANLGFREVYNYPYSHATLLNEILAIRAQCKSSTIMCVGGGAPESGILNLVACAKCLDITTQTIRNEARLYGLAYWYMTPQLSFGFSRLPQITQNIADTGTIEANSRLSWHLNLISGGWRLGNFTALDNEKKLYKKIFLK